MPGTLRTESARAHTGWLVYLAPPGVHAVDWRICDICDSSCPPGCALMMIVPYLPMASSDATSASAGSARLQRELTVRSARLGLQIGSLMFQMRSSLRWAAMSCGHTVGC